MGSGLSQQADTQLQSEVSQYPGNHHKKKTTGVTTTTTNRLNRLPHDCEAILKDADTPIDTSSIDQLYAGVFLDKKRKVGLVSFSNVYKFPQVFVPKRKKYWVDKASNGNCFLVYSRDLMITWGGDKRYWHWSYIKETSEEVVEVAELLNVCWLEINGKFDISKLTPGIKYEVVFIIMLKDHAYGWEVPINVRLVLSDGFKQEHKENLLEKPRSKWIEINVGEFMVDPKKGLLVEFSLYGYEGGAWKKGLLVKGAAIRPKH